jgi:acetyl-CoA acetyltransferase
MNPSEIVIIGVGETKLGKLPGHGATQLQAIAAMDALRDAGLAVEDIDGLINQDPYAISESMFSLTLCEYLGIRPSFSTTCDVAGSVTPMTMLQIAAWAIRDGRCEHCLVMQGENMATSRAPGSQGHMLHSHQGGDAFKEPFGVQGAIIPYALVAQRYCHEMGVRPDDFGHVAVQMRRNAHRLENRHPTRPLSMDDYLASPRIADPLRYADCSLVSDGAAAFVVTRRENARGLSHAAVSMDAFEMAASHCSIAQQPDLSQLTLPLVTRRLLKRTERAISEFDLYLVHDAFSYSVLVQLEGMGVCAPGHAFRLFAEGEAAPEGRTPVNPHGGLLGQAHFGGALHGVEAVRQLRGDATGRQVLDAERALWCGNGGIFSAFGVMALSRVDA